MLNILRRQTKNKLLKNCKIFIITMSWNVFKPAEPLFWLLPLQGEKIDCSENLKDWTSIWEDLDMRVVGFRFAIFD